MPAPDAVGVAYAVVFGVPLLIAIWYAYMYREIGKAGLTGGSPTEPKPEPDAEPDAEPEA